MVVCVRRFANQAAAQAQGLYQAAAKQAQFSAGVAMEAQRYAHPVPSASEEDSDECEDAEEDKTAPSKISAAPVESFQLRGARAAAKAAEPSPQTRARKILQGVDAQR